MKLCLLILCVVSSLSSIAGQTVLSSLDVQTTTPQSELVHFGDVVDVDLIGGFEYDWRGTLTPQGFLDGFEGYSEPIFGLCRSEAEIADDVVRALSKTLRDPRVSVRIIDRSNRAIARLEGAVRVPSRFQIKRPATLRELLVYAGGLTDAASGEVSIFRPKNLSCPQRAALDSLIEPTTPPSNDSKTLNIKISELLKGDPAANPQILSGDIVTVMRSLPVYVIGAVNNPRPVYIHSELTLSRAIAGAGGSSKDADRKRASILRRDAGETQIIDIDLDKVKRGESEDAVLKPFDIIDVATQGGGKRKVPLIAERSENADIGKKELPLRVID